MPKQLPDDVGALKGLVRVQAARNEQLSAHGEPSRTPSTATDDELNRAANQVRQDYKPKEREEANPLTGEPKREPELYDTPTLKLVLGKIAGELPNGVTLPDLRNIFKKVFQFAFSNAKHFRSGATVLSTCISRVFKTIE